MTEYTDLVEEKRILLEAEKWGKGVNKKTIPLFTVQQQQQPYIYIVLEVE